MPRVIVIGAGIMGASVAYRLAIAGASVTVVEAGRIGGGTSSCTFAWTNANEKTPRAYYELNLAGMKAHAALDDEFGGTPWWHPGGSVEWPVDAAKVERLKDWGYAAEWITPRRLLELEPDIDLSCVGDVPIAYFPDEGWLDPLVYIGAMLGAARSHGATVVQNIRVKETILAGSRVTGVLTVDGQRFEADVVVNCTGRWVNDAVAEAGLHLPMASTVGLLAFTPPVAARVSRVVRSATIHTRPDGAGRLVCIDPHEVVPPFDPNPNATMPQAIELVRRLCRLLPVIGDVKPEAVRMAIRPIPADSYSAVGPVPRVEGYYLAVTHSGVTMAPFMGAAVADEIVHERTIAALADFRPARFFN
jgi:glycine/D-amino acid oxidase-like deaminating enzyme